MAQDLHDFTLHDLFRVLFMSDEDFKDWMASQGLLHGSMDCPLCHQPMVLEQRGGNRDVIWRCFRRIHRPERPKKGFMVSYFIFLSINDFIAWNIFRIKSFTGQKSFRTIILLGSSRSDR